MSLNSDARLCDLSDEELMTIYQQGQSAAFDELYRRHSARVYGYFHKRTGQAQLADDLFQSCFLKLHRSRDLFNTSFAFMPWLFTIARTTLLDWQKSPKNQQTLTEWNEDISAPTSQSPSGPSVDLSVLPANQRLAVEMRYLDDKSFEEIAKHLATSPANVRKLVSRGLKRLKLLVGGDS